MERGRKKLLAWTLNDAPSLFSDYVIFKRVKRDFVAVNYQRC